MKAPGNGITPDAGDGEKKNINSELWHACAGPLVSLPPVGSLVVYFPQGHSEQVAATMHKETDTIPNYTSLPSKLICVLHTVTLHADAETDEVFAQMTLQPVNKYDKESLMASNLGVKQNKQPTDFFCKTLTASDTSTHGGFSVPRRAAEKIFPPLDFSMQPPAQELVAKDLHDATWTFRHVYRGQPKRHLLTTGWSVFVSTKRLLAGDSVLFIRDETSQLLLGIRRANRQQPALSSSVLSSESMHIGVLAAAAHAAANNSTFTIFYNPRASPSEFVVPLAKYNKAMYTQLSLGMRFRMLFETEESGMRRYMGTITGISDLDPIRWKNSQWRNLQIGWDESTAGERQSRVSIWEIEPVATPYYICPPPFFRPKLPKHPGDESEPDNAFNREMTWLGDEIGLKDAQNPLYHGLNLVQWMNMQRSSQLMASASQSPYFPSMMPPTLQNNLATDDPSKMLNFQTSTLPVSSSHLNIPKTNQIQQFDGFQQTHLTWPQQQQLLLLQQQIPVHPPQQQISVHSTQGTQPQISVLPQQYIQQASGLSQQQLQQQQQQVAMLPQLHQKQQQPNVCTQQMVQQQQNQQQTEPLQHIRQQQHELPMQQQSQQQIRPAIINPVIDQQRQPQHFVGQSSPQQYLSPRAQQIQQQSMLPQSSGAHQTTHSSNHSLQTSTPQSIQFQQQIELQQGLSLRQQQQQVSSCQPQLQFQLLQKMQQQQMLSQMTPYVHSQLLQQNVGVGVQQNAGVGIQQNGGVGVQQNAGVCVQQNPKLPQHLVNGAPLSHPEKEPQSYSNHIDWQNKSGLPIREPSTLGNTDIPSCSNSPFNNNQVSSVSLLNNRNSGSAVFSEEKEVQTPNNSIVQELHCKSNTRVKHEFHHTKDPDNLMYRNSMVDQLEASSSANSFCLDRSGEENYLLPPICLEGEVQPGSRNTIPFGSHVPELRPDTLLSRGFDAGKDLQNLLSGYGNQKDIETEISTAGISSQSFGASDVPFKPGCSNDAVLNDNGVINRGSWVASNQPQRMRTYTKVQKRGSVGRSIDVTRYKGYDELRHDLACMFGINGQLEDPHRSEWKLVYVDHENDILLVGDDPWEEFVGCVQSIKILSAAEVQQMSLDGDLGSLPPQQNQAGSGSDNANLWRGHYDNNSASSFDR